MEGYAVAEAPVIVAVAVKLDLAMWRAKFLYTNIRARAKRIDYESEQ